MGDPSGADPSLPGPETDARGEDEDATTEGASGGGVEVDGSLFDPGSAPRLMIVGDSISAGPGCYKGMLLNLLSEDGYADFQFVGEYSDDCGSPVMHSAVSCSTAQQYTQESFELPNCFAGESFPGLAPLMATHQPDLVMLQLGVNDAWSLRSVDAILSDYAELVRQAREQNPSVVLLVAQIQKIRPDCENDAVFARAEELVMAVPDWARSQSQPASPVLPADLWTSSDYNQADDCVHPNAAGAQRMAQSWFEAVSPLLPR
jgi:hypothetical protein